LENKARLLGQDFTLIIRKTAPGKITIVVTKKVAKRAVDRNRIKRILKEAVRSINLTGEVKIIVKNNIAAYKENQAEEALARLLKNV